MTKISCSVRIAGGMRTCPFEVASDDMAEAVRTHRRHLMDRHSQGANAMYVLVSDEMRVLMTNRWSMPAQIMMTDEAEPQLIARTHVCPGQSVATVSDGAEGGNRSE